jgi:hypothetical protein
MHHAEHPPHAAGTWQHEAGRLAKVTAYHVLHLCKAHGVPPAEWDDTIGEALLDLCLSVRSSWERGVRGVDARFFALHGIQAACSRRCKPLHALGDAAALADRNPGPVEQAEAGELLEGLLRRLPDDRLRRIVAMRAAGLSVAEVARAEGVCVQRIRHLLLKARVLLAR